MTTDAERLASELEGALGGYRGSAVEIMMPAGFWLDVIAALRRSTPQEARVSGDSSLGRAGIARGVPVELSAPIQVSTPRPVEPAAGGVDSWLEHAEKHGLQSEAELTAETQRNQVAQSHRQETIKVMVDRFLSWPLPKSVCSDTCVTNANYQHGRYGTSLLTADEARQMLKYVLAASPAPSSVTDSAGNTYTRETESEFVTTLPDGSTLVVSVDHGSTPAAWIEHHKGGDNLNWEQVNANDTPLYRAPDSAGSDPK